MIRLVRVAILLILMLSWGCARPAGAQGAVTLAIDDVVLDNLPEIRVLVSVRDANGVPIADLAPEDFELVEDGRISFPPGSVTAQVNGQATISAMLVVDVSGSMKGKPIDEAKRAAASFIDELGADDRAGLIAFSDRVDVDPDRLEEGKELDFTADKNAVRNAVDLLDTKIGWDTPLYDAIYKGVRLAAREPLGRRAVLVMTDGRDERDNAKGTPVPNTGSLTAPDDPINEASRQGIPVFTIGVGSKIDSRYLSRLALRTGGQYQDTPDPEELTTLFQNVLDTLKQQYVLTYNTGMSEDSSFHSLMIRVRAPQGQAFDEVKFWLGPEVTPTAVVMAAAQPAVGLPAQDPTPAPTAEPTAESTLDRIRNNVQDTIEDQPALAAAIGGGALLLLVLVVVLIVILARGRSGRAALRAESYAMPELEEPRPPASGAGLSDTGPAGPPRPPLASTGPQAPTAGWTEAAPPAWGAPGGQPPAPPAWGQPGPPGGFAPAGREGTRVIERGPKHLAMLVNKSRPDQKYDLKGTVNVGRAQDNQVVVDHPTVSRHHAWIKEENAEFLVFDVGSANGTFVADERLEAPRTLQSGDVVRFGEVEFVFTRVF